MVIDDSPAYCVADQHLKFVYERTKDAKTYVSSHSFFVNWGLGSNIPSAAFSIRISSGSFSFSNESANAITDSKSARSRSLSSTVWHPVSSRISITRNTVEGPLQVAATKMTTHLWVLLNPFLCFYMLERVSPGSFAQSALRSRIPSRCWRRSQLLSFHWDQS